MDYDPECGIQIIEGWFIYQRITRVNISVYKEVTRKVVIGVIRKQGRERKGINNIFQFFWVSLLELGLGVTTDQLPDIECVSL